MKEEIKHPDNQHCKSATFFPLPAFRRKTLEEKEKFWAHKNFAKNTQTRWKIPQKMFS